MADTPSNNPRGPRHRGSAHPPFLLTVLLLLLPLLAFGPGRPLGAVARAKTVSSSVAVYGSDLQIDGTTDSLARDFVAEGLADQLKTERDTLHLSGWKCLQLPPTVIKPSDPADLSDPLSDPLLEPLVHVNVVATIRRRTFSDRLPVVGDSNGITDDDYVIRVTVRISGQDPVTVEGTANAGANSLETVKALTKQAQNLLAAAMGQLKGPCLKYKAEGTIRYEQRVNSPVGTTTVTASGPIQFTFSIGDGGKVQGTGTAQLSLNLQVQTPVGGCNGSGSLQAEVGVGGEADGNNVALGIVTGGLGSWTVTCRYADVSTSGSAPDGIVIMPSDGSITFEAKDGAHVQQTLTPTSPVAAFGGTKTITFDLQLTALPDDDDDAPPSV